jgi:hypothetical protein
VPQTRQVLRHLQARDPISIPSWGYCHQIDDGEDPDPNDVERVPKWGKAHEPQLYPGAKAHNSDLCHHHEEPDEPASNVQPVAAHKGEEGGEKRAALRGRALSDHAGELADLSGQPSRGAGWARAPAGAGAVCNAQRSAAAALQHRSKPDCSNIVPPNIRIFNKRKPRIE